MSSVRKAGQDEALGRGLKEYPGLFPRLIHTHAGLDPGCQEVSELIVLREIMGEFLEPAQPAFRSEMLGYQIKKGAIYLWQGHGRLRDVTAVYVPGNFGEQPGSYGCPAAEHQTVGPGDAKTIFRVLNREYPAIGDNGDRKSVLDPGDPLPSRSSGKGLFFEPGMDREHINTLVLKHDAKVAQLSLVQFTAEPDLC